MPPAATIVEGGELLEAVGAALVAGIGIILVFSIAVWGAARFADLSRNERPLAAGAAALVAVVAGAVFLGAVALGIVIMAGE